MWEYLGNFWDLFVDMSFYLVIGIIFTGILYAFVKKETVLKHVGKDDTKSVIKASVVGVPLPLCSCGVVPTAMYLEENGASKGAVVSFLTSTPQTGVDSIIATYGMMGPVFAIYRAVAAFLSGIFSGIVTNKFCKNESINYSKAKNSCSCSHSEKEETKSKATSCYCHSEKEETKPETTSCCCHSEKEETKSKATSCCCHSEKEETKPETTSCCCHSKEKEHKSEDTSCCCNHNVVDPAKTSFLAKVKTIFTYGFGSFLDEISGHLVIGLIIATLISTAIPEDLLTNIQTPILSMIMMLIIGIPMYVCSTASIPIAISLIMKGISPGAAFVFLFAGPVTNIASLTILYNSLGKKTMAIYLGSVAFCSIIFGLILDAAINFFHSDITIQAVHAHLHDHSMTEDVIAIIFGILVIRSLLKKFKLKKVLAK
ncbi:MAG: hypothetical protein ATN31_01650 [Candidatus Epulonipiscioides saccharophilum]|nr:MAG: hypothetical protein ATN31_01650 [Epulopiscium sp. AS2M-Bin001]